MLFDIYFANITFHSGTLIFNVSFILITIIKICIDNFVYFFVLCLELFDLVWCNSLNIIQNKLMMQF